jgi:hypothetical protein
MGLDTAAIGNGVDVFRTRNAKTGVGGGQATVQIARCSSAQTAATIRCRLPRELFQLQQFGGRSTVTLCQELCQMRSQCTA